MRNRKTQADQCGLTKETARTCHLCGRPSLVAWQNDLPQQLVAKIEDAWPHLMELSGLQTMLPVKAGTAPEFSGLVSSGV